MRNTVLATVGSVLAGAVVAAVVVVGVVIQRTSPDGNPTDVSKPVTIDYGSTG